MAMLQAPPPIHPIHRRMQVTPKHSVVSCSQAVREVNQEVATLRRVSHLNGMIRCDIISRVSHRLI